MRQTDFHNNSEPYRQSGKYVYSQYWVYVWKELRRVCAKAQTGEEVEKIDWMAIGKSCRPKTINRILTLETDRYERLKKSDTTSSYPSPTDGSRCTIGRSRLSTTNLLSPTILLADRPPTRRGEENSPRTGSTN